MRLLRLQLKNYRGIQEVDIHFNRTGLTVIEGPNEIGKTSLFESINVLFNYPDSSNSSIIKAIKPVNKDIGAEIVLEAESGPYTFNYFKRFHKKSETTLSIHKPKPENLTGREAHDRAKTILEATVDTNLWSALNINQGQELQQADFKKSYSLSEALDRAAGGKTTNPKEESLFEFIKNEYNNYYTDNNKEKKPLQEAKDKMVKIEDEVNLISSNIKDLESQLENIPHLENALKKNNEQLQKIKKNIYQLNLKLEKIKELERELESSKLSEVISNKSLNEAKNQKKDRIEQSQKINELNREIQEIQNEQTKLNESYKQIKTKYNDEKEQLKNLDKLLEETEKRLNIGRGDYQYLQDTISLELLNDRKKAIDIARKNAESAELILKNNIVDEKALDEIYEAERILNDVRARSNVSLSQLHIEGLSDTSVSLNDENLEIDEQTKLYYKIDRNFDIKIPEKLNITIYPGQNSDEILKERDIANDALNSICKDYRVNNPKEAKKSHDKRIKAKRQIDEKKEIEKVNLRDLTYEEIETKIKNLQSSTQNYMKSRESTTEFPNSTSDARKSELEIKKEYDDIKKQKNSMGIQFEHTSKSYDDIQSKTRELEIKSEIKLSDCKKLEEKLSDERKDKSDEELDSNIDTLSNETTNLTKKVSELELSLEELGAESIRDELETYEKSEERINQQIRDIETELTAASTRIQIMGEEGLQDNLDKAITKHEHSKLELNNITRKAEAANLLYTIMNEEREKAKQSYIMPFKINIEKLGKLLFNNSFEVQINEDLEVTNRTLNGTTIPFDDLSGGTKEQLSLISRLSCATIVGKESGAPIIIDDALGYTDPVRLESMGVILATAGKTCQIIILTCMPDRYSFVGDAKFINITNEYQALQ